MEAALAIRLALALVPLGIDVVDSIAAWRSADLITEAEALKALKLRRASMNSEIAKLEHLLAGTS